MFPCRSLRINRISLVCSHALSRSLISVFRIDLPNRYEHLQIVRITNLLFMELLPSKNGQPLGNTCNREIYGGSA